MSEDLAGEEVEYFSLVDKVMQLARTLHEKEIILGDLQDRVGKLEDKRGRPKGSKTKFEVPSVEDINNYCEKLGYRNFSPTVFLDFYEKKGWMVGKSHMVCWKAAVRSAYNSKDGWCNAKQNDPAQSPRLADRKCCICGKRASKEISRKCFCPEHTTRDIVGATRQ